MLKIVLLVAGLLAAAAIYTYRGAIIDSDLFQNNPQEEASSAFSKLNSDRNEPEEVTNSPENGLKALPEYKVLESSYHEYQTFNNCGPAALAMTLRHYGINETQASLGQELRPYQVANGDNDDKSVTMEELAEKSKEYDLIPYYRPNGSIEIIKQLINYDMPVMVKTLLTDREDIGHFRVVKGFDDKKERFLQDDSYQGDNEWYSYDDFNELWMPFNYEFLVLVPAEKDEIVRTILKDYLDEQKAWQEAGERARAQLVNDPDNAYTRLNLVIALYRTGDYQQAVDEFEKIETKLPKRALWYQTEPIEAYYELGNYDRVMQITSQILNSGNRAYSELYIIRGNSYLKMGNADLAKAEFDLARRYNVNISVPEIN